MEDGEVEEGMLVEEEEEEDDSHSEIDPKLLKCPFELLQQTKTSIEDIVSQMLSINKESKPKSHLRELAAHSVPQPSKGESRDINGRGQSECQSSGGFHNATASHLMYEKGHNVKATKACKGFKSKYPDIDLVPEDETF